MESTNRVTSKYSDIEGAEYNYNYALENQRGADYVALTKGELDNAFTNARNAMNDYKVAHSDMYQWLWDDEATIRTEINYHSGLRMSDFAVDVPGLPSFKQVHTDLSLM